VVMPTGTGKTEVIIATSVASRGERILVIVPTDPLRQQTAERFETYSLLKRIGVLGDIPEPVVGVLASRPGAGHIAALQACNIVVTTMSSIGLADEAAQRAFAGLFTHVFFDEAHHAEASSWKRFHNLCADRRVLLFTATPFREDGRSLAGKIIYNFPLSDAQDQGFFQPIHFIEVFEPDSALSDRAIAGAAVAKLRDDLSAGFNHLLMARAATIDDADRLFNELYQPNYPDLNPVVIHSRTPRKRQVFDRIRRGDHRIIVCVNMFGEGVDVPNLKIAALHAVHKSLGITLQFIGRFARTGGDVGGATFVANTAEDGVPEALESLYREDADWNLLLADLSYDAIDPQARLSDLVNNLEPAAAAEFVEISTLALRPKMSAQVYRTTAFFPERFAQAFRARQVIHQPQISRADNFLVLVVNQRETIEWTDSRDIAVDSWDLYLAYFDPNRNLLYVHSSRKGVNRH
jgi:superfamily II DNA or RNA helicase